MKTLFLVLTLALTSSSAFAATRYRCSIPRSETQKNIISLTLKGSRSIVFVRTLENEMKLRGTLNDDRQSRNGFSSYSGVAGYHSARRSQMPLRRIEKINVQVSREILNSLETGSIQYNGRRFFCEKN